jgi:hypothetical protein
MGTPSVASVLAILGKHRIALLGRHLGFTVSAIASKERP